MVTSQLLYLVNIKGLPCFTMIVNAFTVGHDTIELSILTPINSHIGDMYGT